jgi:hypothetical protein
MNVVLLQDTPLTKIINNMAEARDCKVEFTLAHRTFTS